MPVQMLREFLDYHRVKYVVISHSPAFTAMEIAASAQTLSGTAEHLQQLWVAVRPKETYYRIPPAAGVNASINDMALWLIAQMGHRPGAESALMGRGRAPSRRRSPRPVRR